MYGKRRVLYSVLARKPRGNKPLGRPMSRGKDNIKMDIYKME
jgi:hypothetical protein